MSNTKSGFLWLFFQLMVATFLLFIGAALFGKQAVDVVVHLNDKDAVKTWREVVAFLVLAPLLTTLWCLFWVWFKTTEHRIIKLLNE